MWSLAALLSTVILSYMDIANANALVFLFFGDLLSWLLNIC